MPDISNAELLDRIAAWQGADYVHPLTCGNNSNHRVLAAREEGGKVILYCQDCDYRQKHIPDMPPRAKIEETRRALETLREQKPRG